MFLIFCEENGENNISLLLPSNFTIKKKYKETEV